MEFWKKIKNKLHDNQRVYLLTVTENSGSSPGRQGFKMMVSQDGFTSGSFGGGIMEYQFVEKIKKSLKTDKLEIIFKRQVHQGAAKDSSGMICSGEQTVVFHPLDKKHLLIINTIITSLENNEKGLLKLSNTAFSFSNGLMKEQFDYQFKTTVNWEYTEQIGYKAIFYIFGGGHVSLATSKIMKMLGFYVIVFDNRKNINTLEENNFVDEKHIINYAEIEKYIPKNEQNYITIMTSKFIEDKLILSQLIKNKHQFLGVLGSETKIDTMFKMMLEEGFSKENLDVVYAPIGLPIKSQTPDEIAISIAAQIIKVKNQML